MRFLALALLSSTVLVVVACGGGAEAGDDSGGATPPPATATATATKARPTSTATASATAQATATVTAESTATGVPVTSESATAAPTRALTAPQTPVPPTAAPTQVPPTPTPTQPSYPTSAQVGVQNDSRFSPNKVTIGAGGTVTWIWSGDVPHNVASDSAGFSTAPAKSDTYSFTFSTPGTYYYLCALHPSTMKGVVEVK